MTAVRRILGIPLTLLVALVVQLAIVNRAPLPGDAGPDLVLLAVTALGAMLGPMTGLVAGFFAGLAVDIAPPGGHLAGEYALVFCLAGYACGRMRNFADPMEEHATITSVTVMAIGAAGGEAAKVALGLMLSDPDVTGPAIRHVLPGAILYDLLLSPLVLWLTALAVSRPARPHAPDPYRSPPRTAQQYGAVRVATAGAAPKLRLGGAPSPSALRSQAGRAGLASREPRLRLAGSVSPALSRTGNGARSFGGRRPVAVNFSSTGRGGFLGNGGMPGGVLSGGFLGDGLPSRALGPSLFSGGPLRRASGPGKGWLRGGSPVGTGTPRGLAGTGPGKGWIRAGKPRGTGAARGLAGTGPGKGWIRAGKTGGGFAPARGLAGTGPGKGWLRPSKPAKAPHVSSPGKGWLTPSKPAKAVRRHSPGKGWVKAGKPAGRAWRPKSPGKGWARGSGVVGKPTTYQSRAATPFRRRRGLRMGGRR